VTARLERGARYVGHFALPVDDYSHSDWRPWLRRITSGGWRPWAVALGAIFVVLAVLLIIGELIGGKGISFWIG
jgi:hypothetical protein